MSRMRGEPTAHDVTTTNGTQFTYLQSVELARLVYLRFGEDLEAATAAWCRLLQNGATEDDFLYLVEYPTHTSSCMDYCTRRMNDDRY